MTKIDILNTKLIIPDDYQQFWVHFELFLALFHISDEKWLSILFKYQFKIRIYTVFRSLDVIGILDLTRMTSNNFSTYSQNILPLKIFSHNHLIIFHKHF